MSKVLYITSNPKSEELSYSLSVGRNFLNYYKEKNPDDEIIEINLYNIDIPFINFSVLNGWGKLAQGTEFEQLNTEEKNEITRINTLTDEFISADKYIFVTPLWNLSIPPKMKAYIDTICIVGKTFKYTENGPIGLLNGKKAIHIQSRGGIYSEGPAKDFEFGDKYIKGVLTFLGISVVDPIIIEGMDFMPDKAIDIKNNAIGNAKKIADNF